MYKFGQKTTGIITYKEVINTKPDLKQAEEQGWAQWADMVPDSVVFHKQLLFLKLSFFPLHHFYLI